MKQTAQHSDIAESIFLKGIKILLVPIAATLVLGIVVSGLHIGAVGGIYVFNKLKTQDHQRSLKTGNE